MSPRQLADDAGRQQKWPYLGPPITRPGAYWGVALATLLVGMPLLIFVIPAGLVLAVLAYGGARWASGRINPDDPRVYFKVILGAVALLALLVSAHPSTWINPPHPILAIILGLVLPFVVAEATSRYIDWNRPVQYWLRLPARVASGPRARPARTYDTAPLMLTPLADADHSTSLDPIIIPKAIEPARPRRALTATPLPPPTIEHDSMRLVPIRHSTDGPKRPAGRHKKIERTATGLRIGRTEFQFTDREPS